MTDMDNQIANVMKRLEAVRSDVQRNTAIRFLSGVVRDTPVDTGYARLNWNISGSIPDYSVTIKPGKDEKAEAPNVNQKVEDGLQGWDGKATIYVTNGLPYIIPLDGGSSKQAPDGFVDQNLMLAKRNALQAADRGLQ